MAEAVELKERLTETAYWADESRVSSVKYAVQKMLMQELGKPYERIVMSDKPIDPKKVEPVVRQRFGIGPVYQDPLPTPPVLNITDVMIETDKAVEAGTMEEVPVE